MLQLAVAVHLPDYCFRKFLAVRFLHGLVKTHGFRVRDGQLIKVVLHVVLYLVVVLVHRLIVFMIFLFLLYRTERLVQI